MRLCLLVSYIVVQSLLSQYQSSHWSLVNPTDALRFSLEVSATCSYLWQPDLWRSDLQVQIPSLPNDWTSVNRFALPEVTAHIFNPNPSQMAKNRLGLHMRAPPAGAVQGAHDRSSDQTQVIHKCTLSRVAIRLRLSLPLTLSLQDSSPAGSDVIALRHVWPLQHTSEAMRPRTRSATHCFNQHFWARHPSICTAILCYVLQSLFGVVKFMHGLGEVCQSIYPRSLATMLRMLSANIFCPCERAHCARTHGTTAGRRRAAC